MALSLSKVLTGYFSTSKLNNNFDKVEAKVNDDLVHRQNGSAQMEQNIDMNSHRLLNVPIPVTDNEVANKGYIDERLGNAFFYSEVARVYSEESAEDVVTTNADVVLTHADVVTTNADVVLTHADVVTTHADVVQTALDRIATNADATQTALDSSSTANGVLTLQPILDNLPEILLADDSATTATTQAGIATAQAVIATDKAAEAAASAASINPTLLAPLSSPAFTDIPTAPTAVVGTNTAQLATTAGVKAEIAASNATSTVAGTVKARISGSNLYITFNGVDA